MATMWRCTVARPLAQAWRRLATYRSSNEEVETSFVQMLGETGVVRDPCELRKYNRDWTGRYVGTSRLALRPKTTEEVQRVLRFCHENRIAVVPQGGNTGLVGGGVPIDDEVVLSLERMNRILEVDEDEGVAIAEAGCVLEMLEKAVKGKGFTVPVDLGAKDSCQLGGLVSTHAAGTRFIRFGPLRGSVLGLEVVLADGTVVSTMQKMRKNNVGIDLQQLFIGSEGTLGVITKVAMKLATRAASTNALFLEAQSFDAVASILKQARIHLAEILSAVEYLDQNSMDAATSQLPGVTNPLLRPEDTENDHSTTDRRKSFFVLLETSGSNADHDFAKLEAFLDALYEKGVVSRGILARDSAQAAKFWNLREGIAKALGKLGFVLKYDVSLPLNSMNNLVEHTRDELGAHEDVTVFGFGHLGDGNVHLNILVKGDGGKIENLRKEVEDGIYRFVVSSGGSISAEHGIGQLKLPALPQTRDVNFLRMAAQIKKLLDPHLILNPKKVLLLEYLDYDAKAP